MTVVITVREIDERGHDAIDIFDADRRTAMGGEKEQPGEEDPPATNPASEVATEEQRRGR